MAARRAGIGLRGKAASALGGAYFASLSASGLAVYACGVNIGSAGLFAYDKKCAEARQWRVPEATLCMTALAGGWAMQQFRHKTAKKSFQEKYYAAIGANVAGAAALTEVPSLRQKAMQMVKNIR